MPVLATPNSCVHTGVIPNILGPAPDQMLAQQRQRPCLLSCITQNTHYVTQSMYAGVVPNIQWPCTGPDAGTAKAETVCYVCELAGTPGKFDPKKAKELGVPHPRVSEMRGCAVCLCVSYSCFVLVCAVLVFVLVCLSCSIHLLSSLQQVVPCSMHTLLL